MPRAISRQSADAALVCVSSLHGPTIFRPPFRKDNWGWRKDLRPWQYVEIPVDVFNVRLLVGLDKLLREKPRYQGDLSASINDALLSVNLNTVKLVTLQGKKKQTARETHVVLLRRLIQKLHHVAEARGCSINQLAHCQRGAGVQVIVQAHGDVVRGRFGARPSQSSGVRSYRFAVRHGC